MGDFPFGPRFEDVEGDFEEKQPPPAPIPSKESQEATF